MPLGSMGNPRILVASPWLWKHPLNPKASLSLCWGLGTRGISRVMWSYGVGNLRDCGNIPGVCEGPWDLGGLHGDLWECSSCGGFLGVSGGSRRDAGLVGML